MQSNRLQKTYAQQARGNGWVGAPAPQFSLKKVRYTARRRAAPRSFLSNRSIYLIFRSTDPCPINVPLSPQLESFLQLEWEHFLELESGRVSFTSFSKTGQDEILRRDTPEPSSRYSLSVCIVFLVFRNVEQMVEYVQVGDVIHFL